MTALEGDLGQTQQLVVGVGELRQLELLLLAVELLREGLHGLLIRVGVAAVEQEPDGRLAGEDAARAPPCAPAN